MANFDIFTETGYLKFGGKSHLTRFYRKYHVLQILFSVDFLDKTDFTEKDVCFFGETGLNLFFYRNSLTRKEKELYERDSLDTVLLILSLYCH